MRVAAIDCGTNSIRLLIVERDEVTGASSEILRRMEVVRLGSGVDRTGRLDPEAIERTLARSREYADQCRAHHVEAVRFVATSASRDAQNAADFVEPERQIWAQWGIAPEVISGAEEAALSFAGATVDLPSIGAADPTLVIDLGGGSTEFVRGSGAVEAARSVDIGCVRMTERHLHSDPPTPAEIDAATADIDAAIDAAAAEVDLSGIATLVGLAGSITTVTAHALALAAYEPERIHLARLPAEQITAAALDLLHLPRATRATLGFMHPGRVDVIGAGALVWSRIVARVTAASPHVRIVTSEHDILDGIAASIRRS